MVTESNLNFVSEIYWEESLGQDLTEQICRYTCYGRPALDNKSLLQAELEWASDNDQIQTQPCETLVLLVGYSLDPLLQSVCVYQPKKVILILNQWYGEEEGDVFAGHLQEGIGCLAEQELIDTLPEFINDPGYVLSEDDPPSVFKTLIEALHDDELSDAVIDITGGKKSMMAGAFLYAAYAGIPISYVDFGEYHPERRRPYGYSCRIKPIANPYERFALREWEQVRTLYADYKFREARRTLETMWPPVKAYFPDEADGYVQTMLDVLRCYEAWDAGDYNRAYDEAQKILSFTPPDAVEMWGKDHEWVTISGVEFNPVPRFYEDTKRFRAYVCDELARIRRLIECNEDYLSAFLRAGSLNEVVMVVRLVKLVTDPGDKTALLNALQDRTPYASSLFKTLLNGAPFTVGNDRRTRDISFPGAPNISVSLSRPMNLWWTGTSTMFNTNNGWDILIKRRNDLTHHYYSPPPEWANDTLAFIKANVEDFFGKPVDAMNINTQTITWGELCELSGMKQYLPPNLRGGKEAER